MLETTKGPISNEQLWDTGNIEQDEYKQKEKNKKHNITRFL